MKDTPFIVRKRFVVLILVFTTAFLVGAPTSPAAADSAAEADALYQQAKSILKEKLDDQSIKKAIDLLEQAAKKNPKSEAIWIELAWRYWMLGDEMPQDSGDDKDKRLALFDQGQAAGAKAIEINKKSVGGLYWYTVNMGAASEMRGILSSLGKAGELFSNINRVDRRDPYYLYGATRRYGSEILIRVPTFLTERFGFKVEYVEEDLQDNIERWPHYFDNYLYLARVYKWNDQREKALEMLEFVLGNPPEIMPDEKAENERTQMLARQMWKELTGKEYPQK